MRPARSAESERGVEVCISNRDMRRLRSANQMTEFTCDAYATLKNCRDGVSRVLAACTTERSVLKSSCFEGGEESALLPLPQLKPALRAGLSAPHLNGNRGFRNAFLMRLRRGRLCQGRRTHAQGTDSPSWWAVDELRRPHCAPGLLAPRGAPRTAGRCVAGGADHPTILRAVPSFHAPRQRNCHAAC